MDLELVDGWEQPPAGAIEPEARALRVSLRSERGAVAFGEALLLRNPERTQDVPWFSMLFPTFVPKIGWI